MTKNNDAELIAECLRVIKDQVGIDLELCDHFTGIRELNNKKYFNVILNEKVSESQDFKKLLSFSFRYNTISVFQNGLNRVAIFINKSVSPTNQITIK